VPVGGLAVELVGRAVAQAHRGCQKLHWDTHADPHRLI
jgi:hypothetical protein